MDNSTTFIISPSGNPGLQAAERGLLSRPWYMGGVGGMMVGGVPEPWDPRGYRPPHHRPRLFLPYYEECKALFRYSVLFSFLLAFSLSLSSFHTFCLSLSLGSKLLARCLFIFSERNGSLSSDTSSFNFHRISEIPDTLYMVSFILSTGQ